MPSAIRFALTLFPYIALIGMGFFYWGPAGYDDSFITYWSAKQLAESGFIGNINGDLIEQGSSVLHVILLAGLYKLSAIPLANLGVYFSLILALLCLPLITLLGRLLQLNPRFYPACFLALSASFSCWAMGGLEASLTAFIILSLAICCFFFLTKATPLNSCALLCSILSYLLVRPESYFVLLAALVALSFFCYLSKDIHLPIKKIVFLLFATSLFFIVLAAVRHHFYGQIFPQPVYAKAATLSLEKLLNGLRYYLFAGQISIIIYSLLMLFVSLVFFKNRHITLLPAIILSLALAQSAFIISAGGDWMTNGRFFVPVIPLLILLFLYFISRPRLRLAMLLLILLESLTLPYILSTGIRVQSFAKFNQSLQQPLALNDAAWAEKMNLINLDNSISARKIAQVIDALGDEQKPVEILAANMGLIPYYLRDHLASSVHFTDLYGLITKNVTQCPELAAAKRNALGVLINYRDYFTALKHGQCALITPDIVYDKNFNRLSSRFLQSQGYHVIYQQTGQIRNHAWFYLHGDSYIAISDALYQKLPEQLKHQTYSFTYKK